MKFAFFTPSVWPPGQTTPKFEKHHPNYKSLSRLQILSIFFEFSPADRELPSLSAVQFSREAIDWLLRKSRIGFPGFHLPNFCKFALCDLQRLTPHPTTPSLTVPPMASPLNKTSCSAPRKRFWNPSTGSPVAVHPKPKNTKTTKTP